METVSSSAPRMYFAKAAASGAGPGSLSFSEAFTEDDCERAARRFAQAVGAGLCPPARLEQLLRDLPAEVNLSELFASLARQMAGAQVDPSHWIAVLEATARERNLALPRLSADDALEVVRQCAKHLQRPDTDCPPLLLTRLVEAVPDGAELEERLDAFAGIAEAMSASVTEPAAWQTLIGKAAGPQHAPLHDAFARKLVECNVFCRPAWNCLLDDLLLRNLDTGQEDVARLLAGLAVEIEPHALSQLVQALTTEQFVRDLKRGTDPSPQAWLAVCEAVDDPAGLREVIGAAPDRLELWHLLLTKLNRLPAASTDELMYLHWRMHERSASSAFLQDNPRCLGLLDAFAGRVCSAVGAEGAASLVSFAHNLSGSDQALARQVLALACERAGELPDDQLEELATLLIHLGAPASEWQGVMERIEGRPGAFAAMFKGAIGSQLKDTEVWNLLRAHLDELDGPSTLELVEATFGDGGRTDHPAREAFLDALEQGAIAALAQPGMKPEHLQRLAEAIVPGDGGRTELLARVLAIVVGQVPVESADTALEFLCEFQACARPARAGGLAAAVCGTCRQCRRGREAL